MLFGVPSNTSGIVGLIIAIAFMSRYAQIFHTETLPISCQSCVVVLYLFLRRRRGCDGRADLDLLNRGVSVAGIAAREDLTTKRSWPEMAPQRLEKIESAPGNGIGSETSNPQDLVSGRAADRALRLTKRWGGLGERTGGAPPRRPTSDCWIVFFSVNDNIISVKDKSCYLVCSSFSAPSA
jgi:hypothetical protein